MIQGNLTLSWTFVEKEVKAADKLSSHISRYGGGGLQPKKKTKKPKKTRPKFEICGSLRFFRYFSVFSVICGTFSVFFGLNFDKKVQPFKNHVNNKVLGGQIAFGFFGLQPPRKTSIKKSGIT